MLVAEAHATRALSKCGLRHIRVAASQNVEPQRAVGQHLKEFDDAESGRCPAAI
jgi:hypothetical protein